MAMLISKYFFWDNPKFKQFANPKNYPVYLFTLIVLAIAWSGVRTIQDNYELQKKISVLKQQNEVIKLQNDNTALQNKYYSTDQYLDLAARQSLGLAGPGEKVLLVPKTTALKYVSSTAVSAKESTQVPRSKISKNLQAWRDFFLGRKIISD